MSKKITITGATGLIGTELCHSLISRGNEVTVFTRETESAKKILGDKLTYVKWNYKKPSDWQDYLQDQDAVIHLAGANLFAKRWTEDYKKEIPVKVKIAIQNVGFVLLLILMAFILYNDILNI